MSRGDDFVVMSFFVYAFKLCKSEGDDSDAGWDDSVNGR